MADITVEKFELTIDGQPIETVGNMMFLKIRLEYAGGENGIQSGDVISVRIDNSASEILKIVGIGNNIINIYGDDPIGKVGERTYRNDSDGNYYFDVLFDSGYNDYYGGDQPNNIKGWIESSIYVEYKAAVPDPGVTEDIEIYINGEKIAVTVDVKPGGGGEPQPLDNPGAVVGKSWRYGNHSGNLWDLPEVSENNYMDFELMRWNIMVGTQNLTWRDLRGSDGEDYFTTQKSLEYSNNNPAGERYQSANEPYLMPYTEYFGLNIDSPFHYENAVIDDYLAVGVFNGGICSAHEYIKSSLRIIRVVGRQENNEWWGKDAFRVLADSNFLIHAPGEPVDRYLTDIYFKDYRGLAVDEFLEQMHREGQLLDKLTAEDILTFDYVDNSQSPFSQDPQDTTQISHFTLQLGDLRFGDTTAEINLTGSDNSVIFPNVQAKNLPYAYWIYYDTKAIEAVLSDGYFNYFNAASFKYTGGKTDGGSTDLWIKLEDSSGGSGKTTEVRIRKVNTQGEPIGEVKFILTQLNVTPHKIRAAITTVNGTASFTLGLGEYMLTEEVPEGFSIIPLTPMRFTVTNVDERVNLRELMSASGYSDIDKLDYSEDINIITNRTTPSGVSVIVSAIKSSVGKELKCGQFTFGLFDNAGNEIAKATNGEPLD